MTRFCERDTRQVHPGFPRQSFAIEWGTHVELVATGGSYSQLVRLQFGETDTIAEPAMSIEVDAPLSLVQRRF